MTAGRAAPRALRVVVPAPWEAVSGGSAYDRALVGALRARGVGVGVLVVGGTWPDPAERDLAELRSALTGRDAAAGDVVVDGLVAAAAPGEVEHAVRAGERVHVLVHLPLGLEGGLGAAQAADRDGRERAALRAATSVLATSRWAADALRERHDLAGVAVARPGVDPASTARGSGAVPQLLQLASVGPRKDQLGVVTALARLQDLPWTAVLAGPVDDPAYAAAVDAAVVAHGLVGRVRRRGPASGVDLERLWASTDLLLLPSRAETWGMVVTEALARGVPAVVGAGTGAVEALLGDGPPSAPARVPGAVVEPGDAAQLAAAVRELLGPGRAASREAARQRRRELEGAGGWDTTAAAVLDHLDHPDRLDRPRVDRGADDDQQHRRPA